MWEARPTREKVRLGSVCGLVDGHLSSFFLSFLSVQSFKSFILVLRKTLSLAPSSLFSLSSLVSHASTQDYLSSFFPRLPQAYIQPSSFTFWVFFFRFPPSSFLTFLITELHSPSCFCSRAVFLPVLLSSLLLSLLPSSFFWISRTIFWNSFLPFFIHITCCSCLFRSSFLAQPFLALSLHPHIYTLAPFPSTLVYLSILTSYGKSD